MACRTCPPLALAVLLAACGGAPEVAAQGGRLEATLERQWAPDASASRQAAFSRDGRLLATSSASGRITVRETQGWRIVAELVHPVGATAAFFSNDGAMLYSSGYDGVIRVWELATRREIKRLDGARGTIWSMDISPDGSRLAAAGEDRIVRIWPLDRGGPPRQLAGHRLNVWEVRFSPDGGQVASASFDETARIWDARSGAPVRILAGHTEAVVGLAYSPDGRLIATASDDSTIRLWRAADGRNLRVIDNGNHVYQLAFSPDGRWLASGGRARSAVGTLWYQLTGSGGEARPVRLWRVADGALVQALPQSNDIFQIAFAPDGRRLVSGDDDGRTRVWRLAERR
jgi:WD40 repeat protein